MNISTNLSISIYKSLQRCKKKNNKYLPQQKSKKITKTKDKKDIITQSYIYIQKQKMYLLRSY